MKNDKSKVVKVGHINQAKTDKEAEEEVPIITIATANENAEVSFDAANLI